MADVEMPARVARLRRDHAGRPVPWFVAWIDGKPDFRVIGPGRIGEAHRNGLCWICGGYLGAYRAFVIGPMCAVNRVSPEPPSHTDCADYAARACPFLTRPSMRRREGGIPAEAVEPAGVMIRRNPGVALVWVTRRYATFPAAGGFLFDVGDPHEVRWYAEGRPASRDEVMASIESGLPLLRGEAEAEGVDAVAELERMTAVALRLVPA